MSDIDARHRALLLAAEDAPPETRAAVRHAVLEMLTEDRQLAHRNGQAGAAVSASRAIAALFGLVGEDERPQEKRLDVRFTTPDQERNLARRLAFLLARADITLEQADEAARKALQRVDEGAVIVRLDPDDARCL